MIAWARRHGACLAGSGNNIVGLPVSLPVSRSISMKILPCGFEGFLLPVFEKSVQATPPRTVTIGCHMYLSLGEFLLLSLCFWSVLAVSGLALRLRALHHENAGQSRKGS
jgi:hypothetical protein